MARIMVIRKMRVIVMVYRYGKDDGDQEFRATTMPISERHQYTNKHQSQNFNNPITRIIKIKLVIHTQLPDSNRKLLKISYYYNISTFFMFPLSNLRKDNMLESCKKLHNNMFAPLSFLLYKKYIC